MLSGIFLPGRPENKAHWAALRRLLGEYWAVAFWKKARRSILLLVGHVWRRMVKEYEKWPWPLATSVDPRETIESRRASAQDFFDANTCCLDPGFLRRLRKVVLNMDAFFTDKVQSFVFFMFANAVLST